MSSAKDFNRAMGAVIDGLRRTHGFSQQKLGKRLGVSSQQISKYMLGESALTGHYLAKLAEIFGVTVGTLYDSAGFKGAYLGPSPVDDDVVLAARYMRMIVSPFHRQLSVHVLKKLAYEGNAA